MLEQLEIARKRVARQYILGYSLMCLGMILTVIFFSLHLFGIGLTLFFLCPFVGFVILLLVDDKEKQYKLDFKQNVIANIVEGDDSNLQIDPNSGIGPRDFVESFLFSKKPDLYKTEDLVYGQIGKTTVHFAEVGAQFVYEGNANQIFNGILFCASFNKHFGGLTLVRPRPYTNSLSRWINQNLLTNNKVVDLENADFNRIFFTQASDQVEARYILTPSLMEKLLELNQYANSTISISFIWSNVYIAFPLNHNYFEAPIFKSLLNADVLEKDLNMLRLMRHVVEELDLNTRIWTKD
ncbi:MAG: DUF3137 domain-containing protein [Pedobacter sp.]|uniref:DUF3137 domain-containing protein n=1 Tax=Pedobacter sp. TaxID=1411316 RepID=UPI002807137B|nr:DUF3137 domain-containing protein [Pedobacter sp.]MDQ8003696.1 DUF3137 domain-containing protein [Pedobacter sp.]